jgi:glycosyltransferase involved in cell wall biosynthesis
MSNYKKASVTWYGDLTSVSSSAQHARAILEPLVRGGTHVHLMPLKSGRQEVELSPWWRETIQTCTTNTPGLVFVNHTQPMNNQRNPNGGPTIMFTHWETLKPPVTWRNPLNHESIAEIWLPNHALAQAAMVEGKISKPMVVIPYPFDTATFNETPDVANLVSNKVKPNTFVFGTNGLWNNRKNIADLVIAFSSEFCDKDNVALVLKVNSKDYGNPNEKMRITKLIQDLKSGLNRGAFAPIVILQDTFDYPTMDAINRRFDAYVSTARGECRNITMMKSMASGKACIYMPTNANRDLGACESNRMYPYGFVSEPVSQMGNYYSALDLWPRPDLGDLCKKMRKAYTDTFTASLAPKETACKFLDKNYNQTVVVDRVASRLQELSPVEVQELVLE